MSCPSPYVVFASSLMSTNITFVCTHTEFVWHAPTDFVTVKSTMQRIATSWVSWCQSQRFESFMVVLFFKQGLQAIIHAAHLFRENVTCVWSRPPDSATINECTVTLNLWAAFVIWSSMYAADRFHCDLTSL